MNLSEALDRIEEVYDFEPVAIDCDGGCGEQLTRHDDRHSKKVGDCQMVMLLCPECAEDAGWV